MIEKKRMIIPGFWDSWMIFENFIICINNSSFANAKHLLRRALDPTKSLPRGEGFREGVT